MSSQAVKLIFGGASFGPAMESEFTTVDATKGALHLLEAGGVATIDTARMYPDSEEYLGQAGAAARFAIDTKYPGGFSPTPSSKEGLIASAEESINALRTEQVEVYYIHAPDRRVPLQDLLAGVDAVYRSGKFKRLGLSNFLPEEVKEAIRICKENDYVVPSVYQGNYNAVARHSESTLLPILREHGIAFYAYSPIAGGFLTKDVKALVGGAEGRWNPQTPTGGLFNSLYTKPAMLEGLKLWGEIATDAGISKADLAYRWVAYHSILKEGDGLIFGARNGKQIQRTLEGLKNGPLSVDVVEKIARVWEVVKHEAPIDNFNR
ncbi:NADP-dependent oxidoreductase domain-containing protein [Aspergillus pseudodeflectus]|uniref:NADP-dependent oxidoreductase domain-containing protein n=1 Tax=Aspergillus pseudodeflectus TaxID=176178 RepID=A0ABR4KE16_9EURO